MMKYFQIMIGLNGCYMPDSSVIVAADTRRVLKDILQWEFENLADAGFVGLNKKALAWLAAQAWQGHAGRVDYRKKYHNYCPYGIECIPSTRAEFKAYAEESE